MSRLAFAILVAMLALTAQAQAAPRAFTDTFDSFDATRWRVGEHQLGRSLLSATNVTTAGGQLALTLPSVAGGGEVKSTAAYASGIFSARIKVADAPSSLTGFFLYAAPDYASEIDIEILNDASGTVLFSTYAGGRQTHTETRALGFDPTAAFHDYEIRWLNGRVTFWVDGVKLRGWTNGVPSAPMALFANAWFPSWLEGLEPATPQATLIDQIAFRPR
jgi:beta-glucanase (GH16 family)